MLVALILLAAQGCLGAFDTLYYHEYKLRLPARPHARQELMLHALRDFIYALLFGTLGWLAWNGLLAWCLILLLMAEIVLTLSDFLEEDRTRKLPPGERVMHALMGILYGTFLAYLLPALLLWMRLPTGFTLANHGALTWLLVAMALGVLLSGLRDFLSARGQQERPRPFAPKETI